MPTATARKRTTRPTERATRSKAERRRRRRRANLHTAISGIAALERANEQRDRSADLARKLLGDVASWLDTLGGGELTDEHLDDLRREIEETFEVYDGSST